MYNENSMYWLRSTWRGFVRRRAAFHASNYIRVEEFMGSSWHIIAFPVILPWREEFWTLPLYFPDLKVGVIPGWPEQLPYQGMPLPLEAEVNSRELQHYNPGDLRQWQAFADYRREQEEAGDNLLQAIRGYGQGAAPEPQSPRPGAWSLAWQLEKMQADQEAQFLRVDQGQDWLQDILKPEPWDDRPSYGPVSGVAETVDPELAKLRYRLWRRVMAPEAPEKSVPLLLGRASRPLFLTLKGWPNWTALRKVQLSLPGCRNAAEWSQVAGASGRPPWQEQFAALLGALLTAAADNRELEAASRELQDFLTHDLAAGWPLPEIRYEDLEVWGPDSAPEANGPVLCWGSAGAAALPG